VFGWFVIIWTFAFFLAPERREWVHETEWFGCRLFDRCRVTLTSHGTNVSTEPRPKYSNDQANRSAASTCFHGVCNVGDVLICAHLSSEPAYLS
jgi:hypothetical protein